MKKFIKCMLILGLILLSLEFVPDLLMHRDREHASLTVTFDGKVETYETMNRSNFHWRNTPRMYLFKHPKIIKAKSQSTIHAHFYCPECGKDEEFDMVVPTSKMFHCECRHEWLTRSPYEEVIYLVVKEKTG